MEFPWISNRFKTFGWFTDLLLAQIKKEERSVVREVLVCRTAMKVLRGYQYNTPVAVKINGKFTLRLIKLDTEGIGAPQAPTPGRANPVLFHSNE